MHTHLKRYGPLTGAFALALVLASCTGGSSDPTPAPSGTPSASADAPSDLQPVDALQAEIIGEVDDEAWARVENDRFEAAVAACMRDAGFEYTPEEYIADSEEEDTESLEYAKEFGYGISTLEDEEFEDEEYEPTPNDLYIESLSDTELDAYWFAYDGEPVEGDDEGGDEIDLEELDEDGDGEIDLGDLEVGEDGEIDLDQLTEEEFSDELDESGYGGCQGVAYEALEENPLPYDLPEHQDVLALLDEMYSEISVSDEILEAEEAWIACMAEAGYPDLETTDDASYLVFDAYDAAWAEVPEDAEDIDPALIAPVVELEIAVATADFECRESAGLDTAYDAAQREAETAFVAEHRDALVAFFEDMGEALKS